MELRSLRYFLTVVESSSISKAAKVLNITQPTLSRQLAYKKWSNGRAIND
ncbi:LysR family transcriptional regulator [Staphylococcus sp. SNAZ 59]|nr:LysR family transcriptional regulator [Staphylococcus sp. S59]MBL0401151.1 LysR family transcriptional regulator [Staphylococcus sp. S36]RXZ26045.1 LysR family transcriptional regulator [Staphylococcus sp. SNAZ 59]RXZ36017.1 LysR family transcriptional regulator [Staphylococcus sp. SNAZ 36]